MTEQQGLSANICDEQWLPVPGWDGYWASSLGRIRGKSGKVIAGYPNQDGYFRCCIREDGKTRSVTLHSMVAATFIGPRPPGFDIDHIDRVRSNNAPSNLRYCTHADNMKGSVQPNLGLRTRRERPRKFGYSPPPRLPGEMNGRATLTEADAREILALPRGAPGGERMADIALRYGVCKSAIHNLLAGKSWKHLRGSPADSQPSGGAE